jgi:hypothetical protein
MKLNRKYILSFRRKGKKNDGGQEAAEAVWYKKRVTKERRVNYHFVTNKYYGRL